MNDELHQLDKYWMRHAMALSHQAKLIGEVPVGAIVVANNRVIGEGYNQSITQNDPSAHAEMIALRRAASAVDNYRIVDATLYVTLEPCPMCAGMMVHSRISRLVFGAFDAKTGAAGSVMNLVQHNQLNHQLIVSGGVLERECAIQLSGFFKKRRAQKRRLKLEQRRLALQQTSLG